MIMTKSLKLHIADSLDGRKAESVLEKELLLSRSLIGKLKRIEGAVLLDGKEIRLTDRVYEGSEIEVKLPCGRNEDISAVNIPLQILYEDDFIIAVNKPFGMPSHPSRVHREDTLLNALKFHLGYTGHIITRLDKDTTGAVLVAKDPHAAAIMTEQMKKRKIYKEYIAFTDGIPKLTSGRITAPIIKTKNSMKRVVSEDGQDAVTEYEVLGTDGKNSVVKLVPITGRTHQLRVHMNYIGCPIYGDSLYGKAQTEGLFLHCRNIKFLHPVTDEYISIVAPTDGKWDEMCCKEGIYDAEL